MQHPGILAGTRQDSRNPAVDLLAALLLHHSPEVRRTAVIGAKACCEKAVSVASAILAGLQMWLRSGLPQALLVDASSEDLGPSPSTTAQRCCAAVANLTSSLAATKQAPPPEYVARLLQIASNPQVAFGGLPYKASWDSLRRYASFLPHPLFPLLWSLQV